jgi:type IV secretory pathway VirJ component
VALDGCRENEGSESVILAAVALAALTATTVVDQVALPGFGTVSVYRPEPIENARGVVLFVSGDGGWNLGVVDMARRLAPHAIVAGLSMPVWQKAAERQPARCWYPAGELEPAAQALEKRYRLPRYVPPILVGYSSGATVVYGALAQAPSTTFTGAVSLGFCPDLEVARPLCGSGGWTPTYDAKKHLGWLPERRDLVPPWHVLQGSIDKVCTPEDTAAFVKKIPSARLVWLDKVGHGFSVPSRWGKAFDDAVAPLLEPESLFGTPVKTSRGRFDELDLPLEVTWPEGAREVVVFVSGDGGWADLDRTVASELASRGIAVVGWNALKYFWKAKTPEGFRADLERLVGSIPDGVKIFAGGYSFGAETVPVALAASALAEGGALSRIAGLVLLEPGPYATFEVRPLDWIRKDVRSSASMERRTKTAAATQPAPRGSCTKSSRAVTTSAGPSSRLPNGSRRSPGGTTGGAPSETPRAPRAQARCDTTRTPEGRAWRRSAAATGSPPTRRRRRPRSRSAATRDRRG